jgi:hypothetical protein
MILAPRGSGKSDSEVRLRPKPFATLRYLVQKPRRLVTHGEIREAVWAKRAMSEPPCGHMFTTGAACSASGSWRPWSGRGCRFVAEIRRVFLGDPKLPSSGTPGGLARNVVVGRRPELAVLSSVGDWKGTAVFVTGEAGVGKTRGAAAPTIGSCSPSWMGCRWTARASSRRRLRC